MPVRTPTHPTSSTATIQTIQTLIEGLSSKFDTKFKELDEKVDEHIKTVKGEIEKVDGHVETVKGEIVTSEKRLEALIIEQTKKISDKIISLEHPNSIIDNIQS